MFNRLLDFAVAHGLLAEEDRDFARNALLEEFNLVAPPAGEAEENAPLPETVGPVLAPLVDYAAAHGIIEDTPYDRDRFGDHLISLILPMPSLVSRRFHAIYDAQGAEAATDWFYAFCRASNAIHVDAIRKNIGYFAPSSYGTLEITINLSKPEKDPREIARQKAMPSVGYPKCMLCVENEGYAGRPGYPTHETLRTVRISMCGAPWRLQYSPYSYYSEHCIVLNEKHVPMAITKETFSLLEDFVDQFPAYFLGSNADLPIVGGSILSHNHFQGGRHTFPIDNAPVTKWFTHPDFPRVRAGIVRWPMTCLEAQSEDAEALTAFCDAMLRFWRGYDDASAGVLHETEGQPHNTITPIARKEGGVYRMKLVLRNNRTDDENPLGIFHPHANLHHIKRENIGLIEVMGLFILPGRLQSELAGLEGYLTGEKPLVQPEENDPLFKHYEWMQTVVAAHGANHTADEAKEILRQELCTVCSHVLEDAGVFKLDAEGQAAFERFLGAFGMKEE